MNEWKYKISIQLMRNRNKELFFSWSLLIKVETSRALHCKNSATSSSYSPGEIRMVFLDLGKLIKFTFKKILIKSCSHNSILRPLDFKIRLRTILSKIENKISKSLWFLLFFSADIIRGWTSSLSILFIMDSFSLKLKWTLVCGHGWKAYMFKTSALSP